VIFLNERGEVTEGCFTNVFVRRGGYLLTPPVECGLLDGILRRSLLGDPVETAFESVLRPGDLEDADEVLVGNSVRGLVTVQFEPPVKSTEAPFPGEA